MMHALSEMHIDAIGPRDQSWGRREVHKEFGRVLQRIMDATVVLEPFPHIAVSPLFSDGFYKRLMHELPGKDLYKPLRYAGTDPTYEGIRLAAAGMAGAKPLVIPDGCCLRSHRKNQPCRCYLDTLQLHDSRQKTGWAIPWHDSSFPSHRLPFWVQAFRLVHSSNFTSLLIDKFKLKAGKGVPLWKRKHIHNAHIVNTAAIRIEPTQYHLTPHIDVCSKIVTWQFFHPRTKELSDRGCGTYFFKPKPEHTFQMNDLRNPQWLAYEHFERVLEHPVLPNYFFAFAPNNHSFHGANITEDKFDGASSDARRTFLGFITAAKDGLHHFDQSDWVMKPFVV